MMVLARISLLCLGGCSLLLESPPPLTRDDAGVERDAGIADAAPMDSGVIADCEIERDPISGLCLRAGKGASAICPEGRFATRHAWIDAARAAGAMVVYAAADGSGDGSSTASPTVDPAAAIGAGVDAAVVVLAKGSHSFADPAVVDLTYIGACSDASELALGGRGPITRSSGESLRIWGLGLRSDSVDDDALIIAAAGASVSVFQAQFSSTAAAAIEVDSVTLIEVRQSTFGSIGGRALGGRGSISSVVVDDNNFLGPLGGDGIYLGPLGGDGIYRISGNNFAAALGDAITVVGLDASVTITISDNQINGVAGVGVRVAESAGSVTISGNAIGTDGVAMNGAGMAIGDVVSPGSVSVSGNAIFGAASIGIGLLRNSGSVAMIDNTIAQTHAAESGAQTSGLAIAYGVAIFDCKTTVCTDNTISDNATAGVIVDMDSWGAYISRADLAGAATIDFEGTLLSSNGVDSRYDVVLQNTPGNLEVGGWRNLSRPPPETGILPTARDGRTFQCGNGDLNGAEECDDGDLNGQRGCDANCQFVRGKPLAVGYQFFCAHDRRGRVFCMGDNSSGQIDPESREQHFGDPVRVAALSVGILEIGSGDTFNCARHHSGEVSCWGGGSYDEVGMEGAQRTHNTPNMVRIAGDGAGLIDDAVALAVGSVSACAVVSGGALRCWGRGLAGLLGDGRRPPCDQSGEAVTVQRSLSVNGTETLSPVDDAVSVAVGRSFACYRSNTGAVYCWGGDNEAQLGLVNGRRGLPFCALGNDNEVRCSTHAVPAAISGAGAISVGGAHACAITDMNAQGAGTLRCWGSNTYGQAAPGNDDSAVPPNVVMDGVMVLQVEVGDMHSCALLSNTQVFCWGANERGELGRGSGSRRGAPQAVLLSDRELLSGQRFIAAGKRATCAFGRDGVGRCWGKLRAGGDLYGGVATVVLQLNQ
jgi:cysteine-rich repeat protein